MNVWRLLFLCVLAALCVPRTVSALPPSDTIPDDAVCLMVVKVKSTDPGIAWILNTYKKWFMHEKLGKEVNNIVEDFNVLEFDEIAGGLLLNENGKPQYLAVGDMAKESATVTFKYKDMNLKLKIKEREEVKGLQQGIVKALMEQWFDDKDKYEDDGGIVISRRRAEKGEVSVYAFVDNRVIVGTDYGLVKEAKRVSEGALGRAGRKDIYARFLTSVDQDTDGYLFIDNRAGYLTTFARKKESLWHLPVLISGDDIDALGVLFNIIDSDSADVRAIFQGRDPAKLDLIESDARFMAEFARRKLMLEKVDCVYDVVQRDLTVIVHFTLRNIEPYVKNLLRVDTQNGRKPPAAPMSR
jgi:hypothetical protein